MKLSLVLVAGLLSLSVANEAPQEPKPKYVRRGLQSIPGFDPEITISGIGCFPSTSQVHVQDGKMVAMQDLRVGDKVLVDNLGKYEPVYSFGHVDRDHQSDFLSIRTKGRKQPLEITGEHLVFLHGKPNPVRADSVHVGDVLRTATANAAEVTKITTVTRHGMYAPLTASGSVVVDGIVASTYIAMQDTAPEFVTLSNGAQATFLSQQNAIHMFFAPYRMLCLGVPGADDLCHARHANGIAEFAVFAINLGHALERQPVVVQILAFPLLLPLLVMMYAIEMTFGAAFAPVALVALAGFALYVTNKRTSKAKAD